MEAIEYIGREFDGMWDCAVNWIADDADKGADVPEEWRRLASVVNLIVNDHEVFRPALDEIEALARTRGDAYATETASQFRKFVEDFERAASAGAPELATGSDGLASEALRDVREAAECWVQDEDEEDRRDASERWQQVSAVVNHVVANDDLLYHVSATLAGVTAEAENASETGAAMREFVGALDSVRRTTHIPVERKNEGAPAPM